MKSKQCLDVQQMQHLQEMGLNTSNASMLYCDLYDEEYILVESKHRFDKEENAILLEGVRNSVIYCKKVTPAYTLQDVLELLPGSVNWNRLLITSNGCECMFQYALYESDPIVAFHNEETIDAAYDMLCWCIENRYIKTENENMQ